MCTGIYILFDFLCGDFLFSGDGWCVAVVVVGVDFFLISCRYSGK